MCIDFKKFSKWFVNCWNALMACNVMSTVCKMVNFTFRTKTNIICNNDFVFKLCSDVSYVSIMDYGRELQGLICKAHRVGFSMQVAADGYLPSRRHNFAMGLASMHIAQLLDVSVQWSGVK